MARTVRALRAAMMVLSLGAGLVGCDLSFPRLRDSGSIDASQLDAADASSDAALDAIPPPDGPVRVQRTPLGCVGSSDSFAYTVGPRVSLSEPTGYPWTRWFLEAAIFDFGEPAESHLLFVEAAGFGLEPVQDTVFGADHAALNGCGAVGRKRSTADLVGGVSAQEASELLATVVRDMPALLTLGPHGLGVVVRAGSDRFDVDLALGSALAAHPDPAGLAVGDVDGDGVEDLVLAGDAEARVVTLRDGRATVVAETAGLPRPWLADFDGDGHLDLLLGPPGPERDRPIPTSDLGGRVLLGDGRGAFRTTSSGAVDALARSGPVAVVDVDLDGDPDIVHWATRGEVRVTELLRNQSAPGALSFVASGIEAPDWPTIDDFYDDAFMRGKAGVADLDRDGFADVVAFSSGTEWFWVRGGASSRVTAISGPPDRSELPRVSVGDADGDGDVDVATARENHVGTYTWSLLSDAGSARSLAIQLRGVPHAGTQVCLSAPGALGAESGCTGALLGHSLGLASTEQSDFATTRIFSVPEPHDRVDVRVIVRSSEGVRTYDVPDVERDARVMITIDD